MTNNSTQQSEAAWTADGKTWIGSRGTGVGSASEHIGVSPDYLDTMAQKHVKFSGLIEIGLHNPVDH